jgi:hypothetical protein
MWYVMNYFSYRPLKNTNLLTPMPSKVESVRLYFEGDVCFGGLKCIVNLLNKKESFMNRIE